MPVKTHCTRLPGTVRAMRSTLSERLEQARADAGFTSPRAAAREFGWKENTYKSRENGLRGTPDQDEVRKYARAFGVSFIWLLTGEGEPKSTHQVVVMGRIGAGAAILPEIEQVPVSGLYEVRTPFLVGRRTIAFEVIGDSMWPRYDPGDIVICGREGGDPAEIVGWEAAVRTADGHRYLKRIVRGAAPDSFDLESHNAPTIRGVQLEWVARVDAVVRAETRQARTRGGL